LYPMARNDETIRAIFAATFENVDRLWAEVERRMIQKGLDDRIFCTELLLRESLNNAVRYGCKGDPRKMIEAVFLIDEEQIVIEVTDEGEGFDWRTCINGHGTSPDSAGLGLFIMKKYASELLFNETGNKVIMKLVNSS
jgi:serine/threonine-protein kinase RsbW